MMENRLPIAMSLVFIALLLAGCASNEYVPCCQKQNIYNLTGPDPTALLANPYCNFTNGSVMYAHCDPASTGKGMANCTNGTVCSDLHAQEECSKTSSCTWDSTTSQCTGAGAYWMLPMCADPAPASCVNEKCSAMICGYTRPKLGPMPVGSDFNQKNPGEEPPFALGGDALSGTGLYGTSCAFKTMNNKLYNQVRQSKGELWVNSFRFGVGRSYSDYEQARYYFPVSDRFCSVTGVNGKDRFLNYVNYPATWCAKYTQDHYHCGKNNLNFSTPETCKNYCLGLSAPQDCNPVTTSTPKYLCKETEFLYDSQDEGCMRNCQLISDPDACSSDTSKYPFLEQDARFKSMLQADYVYGTNTFSSSCGATSSCSESYKEACKQENWRDAGSWPDSHYWCKDFYPFAECSNAGLECLWNDPGSNNNHRQDMQWKQSREFSVELDYDYYKKTLQGQMPEAAQQSSFECASGMECTSGFCDMNSYHRTLCIDKDSGELIACGCEKEDDGKTLNCGYLGSGEAFSTGNATFYVEETYNRDSTHFGFVGTVSSVFLDAAHTRDINSEKSAIYVFTQEHLTPSVGPNTQLAFLQNCSIEPLVTADFFDEGDLASIAPDPSKFLNVKLCLMEEVNKEMVDGQYKLMPTGRYYLEPEPCDKDYGDGLTNQGKLVYASAYQLVFNGALGKCKLNDQSNPIAPYLSTQTFGWCQPCTYATLAVQKVDFVSRPWNYNCYAFRAYYDYSAESGSATTMTASTGQTTRENGYDVSPIRREFVVSGRSVENQDGTIYRGELNNYWDGHSVDYQCSDQWDSTLGPSWHNEITTPSLPYIVKKTRDYLAASVMPILDISENGPEVWDMHLITESSNVFGTLFQLPPRVVRGGFFQSAGIFGGLGNTNTIILKSYTETKKIQDIDGAVIYAIANLTHIRNDTLKGRIGTGDGLYGTKLAGYLGIKQTSATNETIDIIGGTNLTIYSALLLKKNSTNPPLVAIDIGNPGSDSPYETLDKFFYKPKQMNREWRIANAVPDEYPGAVDLLLQEWVPTCDYGWSDNQNIEHEFGLRMNFSRNLLKNYSKPSLIWKFHFPKTTQCDVEKFTSYLFDHQAEMVDAGITGLVYDAWMTKTGEAYMDYGTANQNWDSGEKTGTTDDLSNSNEELTLERAGMASKTDTFCVVQNYSKKIMGLTRLTFGQKIYAKNASCYCQPCSPSDFNIGFCAKRLYEPGDEGLAQLYCMDGETCEMPAEFVLGGWTNYSYYRCPALCANTTACTLCSEEPAPATGLTNLFCRVETSGGSTIQATKDYTQLSDDYWDILSALPNQDKCCLNTTDTRTGETIKYTYVKREGVKQQNEFLQFPRRGDLGIDCGRVPNTDILTYCNVKVPITNNHLFCSKVSP